MKIRIDKLLVDRELASSRQKAVALLMAGAVLVDGVPVTKPGKLVSEDASVRIRGEACPYVSRGGIKLEHAIKEFKIDVCKKVCMDVGASTGGFTDCLLQHGASKVYAIDVGYGQLAQEIANDPRVVVIDRQNIRYLVPERIPGKIDIVTVDVSFISLKLVMPVVDQFLSSNGIIIVLIKPQFEVGRELVGKGGIVNDPALHQLAVEKVLKCGSEIGWSVRGVIPSPIEGSKGNKEFLALFLKK